MPLHESRAIAWITRYGTATLLSLVALWQIAMAHLYDLTPWKGGGFGMFSTIDSTDARFVRIYLQAGGREIPAVPPQSLPAAVVKAQALPTQANLDHLADQLVDLIWVDADASRGRIPPTEFRDPIEMSSPAARPAGPAQPSPSSPSRALHARPIERGEPLPPPQDVIPIDGLRVELWKYTFAPRTNTLKAHLLRKTERQRASRHTKP